MTVMLYKRGTEFVWEGLSLASVIVDESEVDAAIDAGWFLRPFDIPAEAVEPAQVVAAPVVTQEAPVVEEPPKRGRPRKEE